jgi:hypothetical protein
VDYARRSLTSSWRLLGDLLGAAYGVDHGRQGIWRSSIAVYLTAADGHAVRACNSRRSAMVHLNWVSHATHRFPHIHWRTDMNKGGACHRNIVAAILQAESLVYVLAWAIMMPLIINIAHSCCNHLRADPAC